MMEPTLTPEQIEKISNLSKEGREYWKKNQLSEAESCFLRAWGIMQSPTLTLDYSQSIARGLVAFFKETKQYEKAISWLTVMHDLYTPKPSDYVEFIAATVYFDAGKTSAAYEIFDKQYKKYGKRPFTDEDKKYLNFYLTQKKCKKMK
ncbi:hypothetical protein GIV23_27375 [Pseudomonas sp. PA-1-2A]|uniref:tetratricopeptide repeat protein n=2 Tax=Pseudomonas TaxID=286 RepID=UPI001EEF9DEA|nr:MULTISPECIES: hypothetical protein [Pseudomonas]MCF5790586.1 hypothetical protein [Pseudomonas sp. PA-1-6G]MCF5694880.1 hypothetical protein [Pseudomonas sp. PA-1-8C]MCF5795867.1 hypothetical protein [Pseudomonas sp. PA-1-6B]MCF5817022.1 hypothetical protein [Pseudomonas sp. PA-1-2A]MCF8970261.1 hypothetical protein [Pseudomonas carnis]